VADHDPHFMGVPGGAETWQATEDAWQPLLEAGAERAFVARLIERLRDSGLAAARPAEAA
jgi:hypothetical protein